MRILLDTNVIVGYLLKRENFFDVAKKNQPLYND